MNKTILKLLPLTLLPGVLFGTVGLTVSSPLRESEVAAAPSGYTGSTLPTTINLNDCTENEIRSYYSALNDLSLSGNDLLIALKGVLSNGQKYHSYDHNGGKEIWQMYEITDRDWELSPASETTTGTYDPATNSIIGYSYGTSKNAPGSNPYVHTLYHNRGEPEGNVKAWDDHGGNAGTDREHIWPKSRGFDDDSCEYGARGDIMHLWSGDHPINSYLHSNLSYGFVDPAKITKNGNSYGSYLDGNYVGTSATLGSGSVFEPQDSDKGDIARACFYMVARYNNLAGNDNTIDSGNPNLVLTSETDTASITSTASKAVGIGVIQDLLAWHHLDPVDEYEIHRNNLCFNNYTNNRNPFIDFPDWADAIWGTVTFDEGAHKVTTYNSTPSGTANPLSDYINGAPTKVLTDLSVTGAPTKLSYKVGEAFDPTGLTITATYDDASTADVTKSVKWSTLKEGDTQVTGTYTAGGVSKSITVGGLTVAKEQKNIIPLIIVIAIVVVVVVVFLLIILKVKGKKAAVKTAKKIVKTASGSSSSSSKKSSSSSKKKSSSSSKKSSSKK